MLAHCQKFAAAVIRQRDAILDALRDDLRDSDTQQQLELWRTGQMEDEDGGGGWLPPSKTLKLISEYRPRVNHGPLDEVFAQANSEALGLPAGAFLLPKIEAVYQAHRRLLEEAADAYERSADQVPSFADHCRVLNELISLLRKSGPPNSTAKGNAGEKPSKYRPLRIWSEEVALKGIQKRVIDLLVENDGCIPLADLAIDRVIKWPHPYDKTWESVQGALNRKLRKTEIPFRLIRQSNEARLQQVPQR